MEAAPLSPETREKLMGVSVATLSTALFKRGLRNQVIQGVTPVGAGRGRNMVGPAYTLRYIPAREDLNGLDVFTDPEHPQRKGVEACPPGAVMVFDSRQDARAASAGGILATRLMVRGCAGMVTDGGFRDSPEIAELDMPAYQARPSAPTNLMRHQAIGLNEPIACGEVAVFPGDVLVGDAEAVIVIPAHLAEEIAGEAVEMTAFEDFVTERVQAGETIIGLYPPTREENRQRFAEWRAANGR